MKHLGSCNTSIPAGLALLALIAPCVGAQPTVEFTNTDPIEINTRESAPIDGRVRPVRATPYPSTINVSGFLASETIDKVTVTLHGLFHEVPDDIDILLVGPHGQNILILSDAGGGWAIDPELGVSITLDDDAAGPLPDDDALVAGRFQPTNHVEDDAPDVFPEPQDDNGVPLGPAPIPSPATELAVFSGTRPNGTWELYVMDDDVLDAGKIAGGWSLVIRAGTPLAAFRRGDSNEDGMVNLSDAVFTLAALFLGGEQPDCADAADADDDGALTLSDAVYTLNHLFRGGVQPPLPGPVDCGPDPTEDAFVCGAPSTCRG